MNVNYFQPSLKLSSKERDGGNVKRVYEQAATPYQRLRANPHSSEKLKKEQQALFDSLDPLGLLTELEKLQAEFWTTAVPVLESPSQQVLKRFLSAATAEAITIN